MNSSSKTLYYDPKSEVSYTLDKGDQQIEDLGFYYYYMPEYKLEFWWVSSNPYETVLSNQMQTRVTFIRTWITSIIS